MTLTPVAKYDDVEDVRRHSEYTPAAAPLALTDSITLVADTNDEATPVTTLLGAPLHALDDTTNADPSLLTSNRPAPLTPIKDSDALAAITFGHTDVTLTTFSPSTSTYGDEEVQREHKRYMPAAALPPTDTVSVIVAPEPLLTDEVPVTTAGEVALGVEHDAAITNADPSPATLGIDAPLTVTVCPLRFAEMPGGETHDTVAVSLVSE